MTNGLIKPGEIVRNAYQGRTEGKVYGQAKKMSYAPKAMAEKNMWAMFAVFNLSVMLMGWALFFEIYAAYWSVITDPGFKTLYRVLSPLPIVGGFIFHTLFAVGSTVFVFDVWKAVKRAGKAALEGVKNR